MILSPTMASLPFLLSFVLFPIVQIGSRYLGDEINRSWLDMLWLGLFPFALLGLAIRRRRLIFSQSFHLVAIVGCIISLTLIYVFGFPLFNQVVLIPYVMEIKAPFYVIFSIVWLLAYGPANRRNIIFFGALLSFIVVMTVLIESFSSGQLVYSRLSGEKNYDAFLLLIAVIVAIGQTRSREQFSPKGMLLFLFLGLIATSSRTALLSVMAIFWVSPLKIRHKVLASLASIVFLIISFVLRNLEYNIESMDRYWMWATFINLVWDNPSILLTGLSVGTPLPVNVPAQLEWLWRSQQEGWGLEGIFPYHFHAFWIRFTITWGVFSLGIFALFLKYIFSKSSTIILRLLSIIILIEGMTMGVFYISNVAIPLTIIIFMATNKKLSMSPENLQTNL